MDSPQLGAPPDKTRLRRYAPTLQIGAISFEIAVLLGTIQYLESASFAGGRSAGLDGYRFVSYLILALGIGLIATNAFLSRDLGPKKDLVGRLSAWWRDGHAHASLATGVVVLASLNILALWLLVHATGGGLASPYAPLLTIPAVFGAFFTNNWPSTLILTLVVASLIAYADLVVADPSDVTLIAEGKPVPPRVILWVSLLLVVIPGTVSGALQYWEKRNSS